MIVPDDHLQAPRKQFKSRAGPDGIHLFDRASGLNILLDEVCVPASRWSAAPRQISVALTNACDLACPYCYASKRPATLEADRIASWLVEFDARGCLGVGFGGGEPTLYRHLPDLCRFAARNTGLAVTFTTHAHRLTETLIAALIGNVHFVRVSMDGVGPTYESLRRRPFAVLLQRLESIKHLSPFGINYVVNACTLPDLDAATELAAKLGAAEFLLLPEQPVRGCGGIDSRTRLGLHQWVGRYRGAVPLAVSEVEADGLPICDPLPGETGLRAYAHIDAMGNLKRSSYESDGVAIGDHGVMQALGVLRSRQG